MFELAHRHAELAEESPRALRVLDGEVFQRTDFPQSRLRTENPAGEPPSGVGMA
mgnify:CR=1 FL=1